MVTFVTYITSAKVSVTSLIVNNCEDVCEVPTVIAVITVHSSNTAIPEMGDFVYVYYLCM